MQCAAVTAHRLFTSVHPHICLSIVPVRDRMEPIHGHAPGLASLPAKTRWFGL